MCDCSIMVVVLPGFRWPSEQPDRVTNTHRNPTIICSNTIQATIWSSWFECCCGATNISARLSCNEHLHRPLDGWGANNRCADAKTFAICCGIPHQNRSCDVASWNTTWRQRNRAVIYYASILHKRATRAVYLSKHSSVRTSGVMILVSDRSYEIIEFLDDSRPVIWRFFENIFSVIYCFLHTKSICFLIYSRNCGLHCVLDIMRVSSFFRLTYTFYEKIYSIR